MSSVLSRVLQGGSYRFVQRLLTFTVNSIVLRKLHLNVTGAATVRLELALASIFVLRGGFRLAFLRIPSLDAQGTDKEKMCVQQFVNVAWLSTAFSCFMAGLVLVSSTLAPVNEQEVVMGYPTVLAMYTGAAIIEALAEPMYVLAHASVLVSWQVAAQSAAFLVRAAVQYVGVVLLELHLVAYGLAELSYAVTLLIMFGFFFWRKVVDASTTEFFALTNMTQLLPGKPEGEQPWFEPELMTLLFPLTVQSSVKYLLAEGDKWVLTGFASLEHMGVYGIVSHLGSLVPRMVFLPIEEATKTIFSKNVALARKRQGKDDMNKEDRNSLAASQTLLLVLLKVLNLVGLVFLCFGTSYAHTLVVVLYGAEKARQGVGTALAFYCIYIPFLGLNGVCEAVVHAIGNEHELMRLNKLLGVFFAIYLLSALVFLHVFDWGTMGLILANCVNMSCRILYSLTFLASYFGHVQLPHRHLSNRFMNGLALWYHSRPHPLVLTAFILSLLVTTTSQRVLLHSEMEDTGSLVPHLVHLTVGTLCLAATVATLYRREQPLLQAQFATLRDQSQHSHVD
ncbi:hypothetical protein PsorP6_002919 [Peronosclerospora sorghi]|uniref:Uncharacterized protein n=1 Tax=Peronosclerospora sorghi TaxID=230839 RepID=A0ACC0VK27_9STRA|nr:hypothetical protein PsorP6_002919 [Peronosclerospora sorghi]